MSWTPARKRFWTETEILEAGDGFSIALDNRPLRTPAKAPLVVPVRGLAEEVAAEWSAQTDEIDPGSMPFTRLCNAAIDNMGDKAIAVEEMLGRYGETDLVCYRAESPDALRAAQAAAWDPLLKWVAEAHDVHLVRAAGVIPVDQPEPSLARLQGWIGGRENFALMALHDLVTLSGSLIIAMAVTEEALDPDEGWAASRVDEIYQAEVWGRDADAEAAAAVKQSDFNNAAQMMRLLQETR